MGTGSGEWWDIKTDFELISDDVAAAMIFQDSHKPLSREEIKQRISILKDFKLRVTQYHPVDSAEEEEGRKILEKIDLALNMYNLLEG